MGTDSTRSVFSVHMVPDFGTATARTGEATSVSVRAVFVGVYSGGNYFDFQLD